MTIATGDMYLSAYLVAKGFEVIDTWGDRRKSFVFTDEAKPEVHAYRAGAAVSAQSYAEALRYIKRLVHDRQDGELNVNRSTNSRR